MNVGHKAMDDINNVKMDAGTLTVAKSADCKQCSRRKAALVASVLPLARGHISGRNYLQTQRARDPQLTAQLELQNKF
jgi:hypothetical protein